VESRTAVTTSPANPGQKPPRRVFVRDLEILASVGVYEIEHRYEQRIVVSVELDVRDDYDGASEVLAHVLDYSKVVDGLEKLAQSRHYKLIETLAERMAEFCLIDRRVEMARIRIEKPDVMKSCRGVGIEIERRRG
jgi:7,8-dihydroneopterin aldolase/epimerase/oxygenase